MSGLFWASDAVRGNGVVDENPTRDRRHRQLLATRQEILDRLQRDLQSVQKWCREHELPDAEQTVAKIAKDLAEPQPDYEPPRLVTPEVDKSLPLDEQQWQLQVQHHRKACAGELYTLARSTLRAGFPSMAFMIVNDVVRIDPDHKHGRAVFGLQVYNDPARSDEDGYAGEWVSTFEKQMRSGPKPQVNHPQFGWIPVSSVTRYEEGQRPWKGASWVSVEKEAELRRDFRNAWEIPSEHFLVKTNVSLEAGVELSRNLETFHSWLQKNFAAFFETPQALQERFESAAQRSSLKREKPMEVQYFATRAEYEKRVEGKVPPNLETNGLYWEPDRTSYFYMNPEKGNLSTLFHEATHQILDVHTMEARRLAARTRAVKQRQRRPEPWVLCENSNFWLIEGLACYFESFEIVNGQVSLGRPDYVRFETAQQRMLDPSYFFYLPAQQFFALGKENFQKHPQVSPLYTQAAGFAHFLMHYEDGLYRDDLIALLSEVYHPAPDKVLEEPSFSRIADVPWEDFDHQYRTHMQNLADQLAAMSTQTP